MNIPVKVQMERYRNKKKGGTRKGVGVGCVWFKEETTMGSRFKFTVNFESGNVDDV